jgi:hypothetical protein
MAVETRSRARESREASEGGIASPRQKKSKAGTWARDNIKPTKSSFFRMTVGPLGLMIAPPITTIVLIYTILHLGGSGTRLLEKVSNEGPLTAFINMHPSAAEVANAMKYVFAFMLVQLIFMPLIPGKMYIGPVAPSGHRPTYKANGVQTFFATIVVWAAGSYLGLFNAGIFYDIALPMFAGLNIFSIFFVLGLYLKGLIAPSTPDNGSTGNMVFDYFWGTELYPRVGYRLWSIGWDIKQFTNCRFGMMIWGISLLSYAAHQYETMGYITDAMLVSVAVQVRPYLCPHFLSFFLSTCRSDVSCCSSISLLFSRSLSLYLCRNFLSLPCLSVPICPPPPPWAPPLSSPHLEISVVLLACRDGVSSLSHFSSPLPLSSLSHFSSPPFLSLLPLSFFFLSSPSLTENLIQEIFALGLIL